MVLIKEEPTSKPINLRPTVTEINVTTNITIQIVKFFFDIDIGIVMLLHCALCIKLKHHTFPQKQVQEYRATGTDDCSGNCPKTLHETVQNGANACEVHGRNEAPNKNINPAKMRGYASKCDALLKAGEAIRTPDIHVGNVTLYH